MVEPGRKWFLDSTSVHPKAQIHDKSRWVCQQYYKSTCPWSLRCLARCKVNRLNNLARRRVEKRTVLSVSGCGFTKHCRDNCMKNGITGWVKNTKAGTIQGKMQGLKAAIDFMWVADLSGLICYVIQPSAHNNQFWFGISNQRHLWTFNQLLEYSRFWFLALLLHWHIASLGGRRR